MEHLKKLYEELSSWTKELLSLNPLVHVYFDEPDNKFMVRECFKIFLKFLSDNKIPYLLVDISNPYFIISSELKAKNLWDLFPCDLSKSFNGKRLEYIKTTHDLRDGLAYHIQIWDDNDPDYFDPKIGLSNMYDLVIIENIIYRPPNPLKRF